MASKNSDPLVESIKKWEGLLASKRPVYHAVQRCEMCWVYQDWQEKLGPVCVRCPLQQMGAGCLEPTGPWVKVSHLIPNDGDPEDSDLLSERLDQDILRPLFEEILESLKKLNNTINTTKIEETT